MTEEQDSDSSQHIKEPSIFINQRELRCNVNSVAVKQAVIIITSTEPNPKAGEIVVGR